MLPALLAVLRESSSSEEAQSNALLQLAQLINDAYDEEAIALCEYMRATGAVQLIASRLSSPVVSIHQYALMLVGNLASLSVDLDAEKTKVLLKTADVFSQILPYIFSEEYATLVYSLAAVQNLCTEIAYVEQLQQAGGLERLQAILQLNDPQLGPFARGILANWTQAKVVSRLQERLERKVVIVQAAARRWLVGFRERRRLAALEAAAPAQVSQPALQAPERPQTPVEVVVQAVIAQSVPTVSRPSSAELLAREEAALMVELANAQKALAEAEAAEKALVEAAAAEAAAQEEARHKAMLQALEEAHKAALKSVKSALPPNIAKKIK